MTKDYLKEAMSRAHRAVEQAERLESLNEAIAAIPSDEEAERILAKDPELLQIVMCIEGAETIIKTPVPAADQMKLFALLRSSLMQLQAETSGMLLRELSSDTEVH